ncbi:Hypothetical protein PHPALM_169 [Phytophthora palmivora]|uniref:Uncharacterized protein n=1 Tax=Phytophthora palmivora TaxID=4796 RepID=A0A2P4YVI9_9STRA|nr:Hypothetical protein PHPALM_169 [Phytophthora palmivora]
MDSDDKRATGWRGSGQRYQGSGRKSGGKVFIAFSVKNWWRKRHIESDDKTSSVSPPKYARSSAGNRHQCVVKAVQRRGPKLGEYWLWLFPILLVEFERLRKAGVIMSTRLLVDIAITLVEDSQHPTYSIPARFNDKVFCKLVTPRHIQDITDRFKIQISSERQRKIHCSVDTHLGELKRLFDANLIDLSGVNWAKKSMILCGLNVSADGVWKFKQLDKDLQEIVAEHPRGNQTGF